MIKVFGEHSVLMIDLSKISAIYHDITQSYGSAYRILGIGLDFYVSKDMGDALKVSWEKYNEQKRNVDRRGDWSNGCWNNSYSR